MKLNVNYRELIKTLINLDDTPHRLSLAFSLGVLISLSPFFGLHTIIAIALAFVFKLNKVSLIIGSWVNTPWSAPFVYYAEYRLGALILDINANFSIKPFTIEHYISGGYEVFLAVFTGSVIIGLIFSIIFYFLVKYIIEKYKRRSDVSFKG